MTAAERDLAKAARHVNRATAGLDKAVSERDEAICAAIEARPRTPGSPS
jgi:hypothetical protein